MSSAPQSPAVRKSGRAIATPTPTLAKAVAAYPSIRKAALALGIPRSTLSVRLAAEAASLPTRKTAPARKSPARHLSNSGLAAALEALAESQVRQGRLLERLIGADPEKAIRVPVAKAQRATRAEKPLSGGTMAEPETRTRRAHGTRFILTSAQNNTDIHANFWESLRTMASHTGAAILVSRFTYNRNAWSNGANITTASDDVWYADELRPHIVSGSLEIADGLIFCAELDRLPTAADPLSGLDSYTRESSGVVGHPKVAMKSMPVLKGTPQRRLYSTGCVTQRNYVDRLAGQKAAFHHTFAALYVEVDPDGSWFARQLVAGEDGEFQDLETVYAPAGMRTARVAAIVYGDLHAEKMDDWMADVLWGRGGIRDTLRPEAQVLHDAGDFTARNHHNIVDPFFLLDRQVAGADTVEGDMRRVGAMLAMAESPDCVSIVADANHQQQAMLTWLTKADIRCDPVNKRYFHKLSLRLCEAIEARDRDFQLYEWTVRDLAPLPHTRFLRTDESCVIGGIELGIHGHLGPNGAKGSPKSFRQLGRRAITAHTHSAGITDGVWTAGVSGRLDMGYNRGPSSWSHSHVLIYENGKRSIITMNGRRWRAGQMQKPRIRVAARSTPSAAYAMAA